MAHVQPVMPGKDRDEESGRYTDTYSDSDFLNAIREVGGSAGTSEIADAVGCTRRNAYNRLTEMDDRGEVTSRKVGGALLWSVTEE